MTKDSRLEKFLKALCSLDYSDLPTPLSRVEVLWNCLITGEATPDFQPQSRTEKYLMTILGVYDLGDIPKPISRAETLLYKLATGDTDVELEDGAKSRYERLLSEIVANGGVGDNVDFEYVTYVLSERFSTLYNTVEKPVKSAILKGNTLVNLVNDVTSNEVGNYNNSPCEINVIRNLQNETLTIIFNVTSLEIPDGADGILRIGGGWSGQIRHNPTLGVNKVLYNYNQTSNSWLGVFSNSEAYNLGQRITISDVMVLEGDYTNIDIPYFEGMQSVQMPVLTTTGKNLFEGFTKYNYTVDNGVTIKEINDETLKYTSGTWGTSILFYIPISGGKRYSLSSKLTNVIADDFYFTDDNKNIIGSKFNMSSSITSPNEAKFLRWHVRNMVVNQECVVEKFQLEESSTATSYKPYKSNILTVSEDVTLRGIGDVQDELNLLTGELTQRIGEVVLDGSENWAIYQRLEGVDYTKTSAFTTVITSIDISFKYNNTNVMCSNGIRGKSIYSLDDEGCFVKSNSLRITINKDKLETDDVDGFKKYLSNNPLTVYTQIATESVKTVDLSTLDQDGNKTKLKTFNDITHVSLSSEGLIPEAEMTVVTKNLDDISQVSTMSLRMNDISDRQNELQNEVDTQSENIDSTMMATTEIYEQTL